jgi:hypothetical protein
VFACFVCLYDIINVIYGATGVSVCVEISVAVGREVRRDSDKEDLRGSVKV